MNSRSCEHMEQSWLIWSIFKRHFTIYSTSMVWNPLSYEDFRCFSPGPDGFIWSRSHCTSDSNRSFVIQEAFKTSSQTPLDFGFTYYLMFNVRTYITKYLKAPYRPDCRDYGKSSQALCCERCFVSQFINQTGSYPLEFMISHSDLSLPFQQSNKNHFNIQSSCHQACREIDCTTTTFSVLRKPTKEHWFKCGERGIMRTVAKHP